MESAMSSQDPFPPLIGFYGSSSQYYGERQNDNCPKFYMICSFFACSLFASVYLSAIATINWQENPTTTTLKVVLIFPSAVCLEAIPTYRVAEVGSLSARAKMATKLSSRAYLLFLRQMRHLFYCWLNSCYGLQVTRWLQGGYRVVMG